MLWRKGAELEVFLPTFTHLYSHATFSLEMIMIIKIKMNTTMPIASIYMYTHMTYKQFLIELNTPQSETLTHHQWWTQGYKVFQIFNKQTSLSGRPSLGSVRQHVAHHGSPLRIQNHRKDFSACFQHVQDVYGGFPLLQSSKTQESEHLLEWMTRKTTPPDFNLFTAGFSAVALALCNDLGVFSAHFLHQSSPPRVQ